MAEQVKQESNIVAGTAVDVLAAAYAAGRKVRFWLDGSGNITGCWQGRNGKTCAVFTYTVACNWPGTRDRSKVYFGMQVAGSFDHNLKVATREAMLQYRADERAAWSA